MVKNTCSLQSKSIKLIESLIMNVDSKSLFTTQTHEPTGASRPSRASNGILINKNRTVSSLETECINFSPDGVEGNINETVSDRRSSFKNESSKDHNAVIESTDSEDFDLKHLKSPLEDRRINAKRHANQAILFTGLVEDRLAFLEQQLQKLQLLAGEDPIVLQNFKDSANASGPSHNPEIKHMTWAEWKSVPAVLNSKVSKAKHSPEGQNAPKSVLEVLIEDPQVTMRRRLRIREKAQDGPKKRSDVNRPATTPKPDASTVNAKRVPERLRIRSRVLLEILEQVTDVKLPPGPHGLEKLVMLRPFKLLFTYEDKIRKRLSNMEELYQRHKRENAHDEMESCGGTVKLDSNSLEENTNEVQNDSRPGLYSNLTDNYLDSRSLHNADADDLALSVGVPLHETNTFEGLEHLRLLVKFMDDDLKPIIELRKKISSGDLRSIAFADLWHLFEHGQEVRAPGSDLQLYRVLKVRSAEILNAILEL